MAGSGSFLESYIAFRKESVYGTAVATDMHKIPVLTWDVNPQYDIYRSGMITGAAGASAPAFGVMRVAGRMTMEGGYSNIDHALLGVLGSGSNTAGTGPYTNRYVPAASQPSFTVDASYGDVPTTKVVRFEGVKFSNMEMAFDAAQGFMNVSCDLLAETVNHTTTTGTTAGTYATVVAHNPIQVQPASQLTALDIGVGSNEEYCVRAGTIRIDRALSANRICLGVDTIKEPVATAPMSVTGTFNVEWQSLALAGLNAVTAKTVHTDVAMTWTDATYSIAIVMPKVVYTAISTPIQQGDALVSTITWEAYGTGGSGATSEPINVTMISGIDYDVL